MSIKLQYLIIVFSLLVFRTVKAQKIFTADFTQQTNKIPTVRNFWDIRNIVSDRLDKDLEQEKL
jgi:hypothetical protein